MESFRKEKREPFRDAFLCEKALKTDTVFPHSVSHSVLNKRPMFRIVVKYQGGN
jgi:hypothetical protein